MKNPLTPAGIEPATFRIVTQHLNHCATAVPGPLYLLTFLPNNLIFVFLRLKICMCFLSPPCVIKFHPCDQPCLNELADSSPSCVF